MTTHVKPTFYSAENETDCIEGGKVVELTSNHEDIGIVSAPVSTALGLLIGSGL